MSEATQNALAVGEFVIDRADERLLGPQGPVRLGHKAYRVLLSLAEQNGRLVTKDALFSSVWDGMIVGESALTSVVKELRRALGDDRSTPRYIESVYGRGYRLIAPVHPVEAPPQHDAPSFAADETSDGPHPPLVLVAAFNDAAIRSAHPYCATEIREEVLAGLARFRELQLVADDRSEEEVGAGRNPERGYVLTAMFLPEREGVKVIARFKRLRDGRVVWAETMSLEVTGRAGGVERIVRRIVGAALPAVDEDLLAGLPGQGGDLYDRYLLAKRQSFQAASFAEAKAAAASLERIIAANPGFALAYPPLARLYNTDFGYTGLGSTGPEERAYALRLAKAGVAADRGNAHAHVLLGFCHLWHGDGARARACAEQAMVLNPYNHVRLQECATMFMYLGDLPRAQALIARAAELNPLPDDNYYEDVGRLRLIEGDHAGALAALESVVQGSIWAEMYRAVAERALGLEAGRRRLAAWRERVERSWHQPPPPTAADLSAWVRRHLPLPDPVGAAFFADLDAALSESPVRSAMPRSAEPAGSR